MVNMAKVNPGELIDLVLSIVEGNPNINTEEIENKVRERDDRLVHFIRPTLTYLTSTGFIERKMVGVGESLKHGGTRAMEAEYEIID